MWPSTPNSNDFKGVACPAGDGCNAPNCLFGRHEPSTRPSTSPGEHHEALTSSPGEHYDAKQLKSTDDPKSLALQSDVNDPAAVQPPIVATARSKHTAASSNKDANSGPTTEKTPPTTNSSKTSKAVPGPASRPISPPPKSTETKPAKAPDVEVILRPSKVTKEPAQFTKRLTYLKKLKEFMATLNEKTAKSTDPKIKGLHLTDNQLNQLAVDEEKNIASQNVAVYENVLKQRLMELLKMSFDEWVNMRKETEAKKDPASIHKPATEPQQMVVTGLSPEEEIMVLSHLKTPLDGLRAYGYATQIPTEAELYESRQTLLVAKGWEICERCTSRFQVFTERREEDGLFTTGGHCIHHWGKPLRPRRSKGELPGPTKWTCCDSVMGTPGCTTSETHVFKVSEISRMASIMPFVETPDNPNVAKYTAVCFDCEMGYTTLGLELMRITAVSWPTHKPILDILVRPLGHILDLNTRFSGITTDKFFNAKAYDPTDPTIDPDDLRIVDSPYAARDLFLSFVSRDTPVLGHSLENDLNTIRLIHPSIVDTVFLYPHPAGLPIRYGLRNLAKYHLDLEIQQAGAAGHDSSEDARATGELIRLKVSKEWKRMKNEDWEIRDGSLHPPLPAGNTPPVRSRVDVAPMQSNPASKRRLEEIEDGKDKDSNNKKAK
ncbi:hypothetical protein EJ04DRAFT_502451 [Polyplosphaeria fusca]|uniref:Exonuclease domain-containing protein n=1 Tax=Polyplosphaeria fusca TaxID=682080 RepID=A0A9P4QR74_9PLEO|nr:hypothetical protein EJ04DRAFT_502451 [Polyplosphaeria fusca]